MAKHAAQAAPRANRYRPQTSQRVADAMSANFDLPAAQPARRYLFVAEPRSGGSLLAEALRATGEAGVPFEYLNPRLIGAYADRIGAGAAPKLEAYFEHLLRHRTTANGVFVLKMLVEQVSPHLGRADALGRFLESFDRVFVMHRRDKLAQAVSYYKASVSDAWNSRDRFPGYDDPARFPFDPLAISQFLRALFSAERQLGAVVDWARKRGKPVEIFSYETVDADFAGEWDRLLKFLELPAFPLSSLATTLEKQRDAVSDRLIEQYLAHIRDSGRLRRPDREKPT
jgi:LPS sulfotransferase NodH